MLYCDRCVMWSNSQCCVVLCSCFVLCYMLCYIALFCVVILWFVLCCVILRYTALCCVILCCVVMDVECVVFSCVFVTSICDENVVSLLLYIYIFFFSCCGTFFHTI